MANQTITKCLIGEARMNFCRVFEPESFNGGDPKYSVILSFDKDDEALVAKIEAAINECVEKAKTSKYGGKLPKGFKVIELKDGDEDYEGEGFPGQYTIKASSAYKPEVVKKGKVMGKTQFVPITDEDEFYSGCYGYASVSFFAYDNGVSKGVTCGLNSLLKSRDGERFGNGGGSAAADFAGVIDDIEDADDDDIEDADDDDLI